MKYCLVGFFLFCSLVSAASVEAVPLVFDLSVVSENFVYKADGLTLTVSSRWGVDGMAAITHTSSGLGVMALSDDGTVIDDKATFDGSEALDTLIFSFDRTVTLRGIDFRYAGGSDNFSLQAGSDVPLFGVAASSVTLLPNDLSGRLFSLSAVDENDSFRVKSLCVDIESLHPTPTPEPATWLLLMIGVGGFMFYRRRW